MLYLSCYTSTDLSRQALQTNEKLYSKFVFELLAESRILFNAWVYASEVGEAFVVISTRCSYRLEICIATRSM